MNFSYVKRPVVIEAVQLNAFDSDNTVAIPKWFIAALVNGTITCETGGSAVIRTLEGIMKADKDDWIIRGVKGELYPCKPDIFEATYEKVPDHV